MNELTIKICGQAGQGMQTVGFNLCKLFKRAGFYIFANQDYMSRVRGGNNFFQLRISQKPVYTLREKSNIIVALDKPSIALHRETLADDGLIVADLKKFNIIEEKPFLDVPMYTMAQTIAGNEIFVNSIAYGVLSGMIGMEQPFMLNVLEETFKDKGDELIRKNADSANAGYELAKKQVDEKKFNLKTEKNKETLVMDGNEAIALAAIKAGCKFYCAYPMTPSTSIMNTMAAYAKEFNIVVEQAEDEIAAINMAIGASFAGARSMVATSGGGFCLMVEGVSLSAMTETPVVIVDAQRPAPATGFPTRTEQADLDFLLSAGHGEFARAIFSPGTIEEAFHVTIHAFNLAEKYQIPVFIMTDQHLADSYRNIEILDTNYPKVERFIIPKEISKDVVGYKRYEFTDSGISKRAIPSWINDVMYVDSDEHTEEGHITEDADIRKKMVEKRFYKKMEGLLKEILKPVSYNLSKAQTVLVGFGSTYGVLKEACESLGQDYGLIHLPQVWPFPNQDFIGLLGGNRKVVVIENNAGGQLARLIKCQSGLRIEKSINKFDGRPFDLDYLLKELKQV